MTPLPTQPVFRPRPWRAVARRGVRASGGSGLRAAAGSLALHGAALAAVGGVWMWATAGAGVEPPLFEVAASHPALSVSIEAPEFPSEPPVQVEPRLIPAVDPPQVQHFVDARGSENLRRILKPDARPLAEPEPAVVQQAESEAAAVVPSAPEPGPLAELAYVQATVDSAASPPTRYPRAARRNGLQGVARVWVALDASGRVLDSRLQVSSGSDLLDEAALEQVRDWRFRPATEGGQPVAGELVVPVRFQLQ